MKPTCRHCCVRKVTRPRGLCWTCFRTTDIKKLYAVSGSPAAKRGVPDRYGGLDLPAEPTAHPPGTPEKRAVLAARAAAGVRLWHPLDNREVRA